MQMRNKGELRRKWLFVTLTALTVQLFCLVLLQAATSKTSGALPAATTKPGAAQLRNHDRQIYLSKKTPVETVRQSPLPTLPKWAVADVPRLIDFHDDSLRKPPTIKRRQVFAPSEKSLGVTAYLLDEDKAVVDRKIDKLVELGVSWVRMEFRWATIEPRKGIWFLEKEDYAIKKLREKKLNVLGLVTFTPGWASSAPAGAPLGSDIFYPPKNGQEFRRALKHLAQKYKGDIGAWQIWTEPDQGNFWRPKPNPVAFTKLLKEGYRGVKEGDPNVQILFAGLTVTKKTEFLETALTAEASSFDALADHSYSNSPEGNLRYEFEEMLGIGARHTGRPTPVWLTEIGWSTYKKQKNNEKHTNFVKPVTEQEQAEKLARRLLYLVATPVGHIFYYELNNFQKGPTILDNFGLLREDLSPKPAFNVAKNLTALMSGKNRAPDFPIAFNGDHPSTMEAYAFINQSDTLVLAIWDNSNKSAIANISFKSDDFEHGREIDLVEGRRVAAPSTLVENLHELPKIKIGAMPRVFMFEQTRLSSHGQYFSPNSDGNRDSVELSFLSTDIESAESITIFDQNKQKVTTLPPNARQEGRQIFQWNGADEHGYTVSDGVYTATIHSSDQDFSNTVVVDTKRPVLTSILAGPGIEPLAHQFEVPYFSVPISFKSNEPIFSSFEMYDSKGQINAGVSDWMLKPTGDSKTRWHVNYLNRKEGAYWFDLTAVDAAGNRSIYSPGYNQNRAIIDFGPPTIKGGFDRNTITPNGDGIDDSSDFTFELSEIADVQISLENQGRKFYFYAEKEVGKGPHTLKFEGYVTASEGGSVGLPNGEYKFEILAVDPFGNISTQNGKLTVSEADYGQVVLSAEASLDTFSPNRDGRDDFTIISYKNSKRATVMISVADLAGKVHYIHAQEGEAAGTHEIIWSGKVFDAKTGKARDLTDGRYLITAEAIDFRGNYDKKQFYVELAAVDFLPPRLGGLEYRPSATRFGTIAGYFSFSISEPVSAKVVLRNGAGREYIVPERQVRSGVANLGWNGLVLDKMTGSIKRLPPGVYRFTLEVRDRAGFIVKASGRRATAYPAAGRENQGAFGRPQ